MEAFDIEVHCPNCGEFRENLKSWPKKCPRCSNDQAIIMYVREDIEDRLKYDKHPLDHRVGPTNETERHFGRVKAEEE